MAFHRTVVQHISVGDMRQAAHHQKSGTQNHTVITLGVEDILEREFDVQ